MPATLAITAGDIDRDGDVDLWISQYKPAYLDGQMPTPYYDANDGEPGFLLRNDGHGQFEDVTEAMGLGSKRNRRTYSTSFVDLDNDRDLDLLKVSDYAGVDVFVNDGNGRFTDATHELIKQRHLFGMSHALGDYNLDGRLDFYAIGMSSTTARRLDQLGLGRDDRQDIHQMRAAMGYGNRMYLWNGQRFDAPDFASQVARTGWSWGATAADFDLDGDEDIYVANGFRSGESCEDYCSTFWRHDIYTGDSSNDAAVAALFTDSMRKLNRGSISWNGFEHNALLQNLDGRGFVNVAFLLGVGEEYDSRVVIGNDLDGDGRPDLLVTEYAFAGRGFVTSLHVYRNVLRTQNHWIGVRLKDSANSGGLFGATAILEADGRRQIRQHVSGDSFLSQHDHVFHFGVANTTNIDRITVQWPNGHEVVLTAPTVDRYHVIDAAGGK